jgi:hypothetical protein
MATNQLAIGFGSLHQDYREYNDGLTTLLPSILDSEEGKISTGRLSYTGLYSSHFYLQANYTESRGKTAYDGFLQAPGPIYTPFQTLTDNTIQDLNVKIGGGIPLGSMTVVVPYVDLGSHKWKREIGKATPYSLTETYSHQFLGVGAKALFSPVSRLVFELGATYGTTMSSNMSLEGYDYPLGNKPYIAANFGVDVRFAGAWHLKATADYRKWEYGASDWIAGAMEPHSQTKQNVYLLSLGYTL